MISCCPSCQSKFVVSEPQLQAAEGVIRCGNCMKLFLAVENEWLNQKKKSRAPSNSQGFNPPPILDTKNIQTPRLIKSVISGFNDDSDRIFDDGRVEPILTHDDQPSIILELETEDIDQQMAGQSSRKSFPSFLSLLFFILLAAPLLAVLYLQWLLPAENTISQHHFIQQAYHFTCKIIQCNKLPTADDYQSNKLIVYSHPSLTNGLIVETIIVNDSTHSLPYPLLALTFSTMQNKITAQRLFSPAQYLKGELQDQTLMPPLSPIHITLEIVDPSVNSSNYTLQLLAPFNDTDESNFAAN